DLGIIVFDIFSPGQTQVLPTCSIDFIGRIIAGEDQPSVGIAAEIIYHRVKFFLYLSQTRLISRAGKGDISVGRKHKIGPVHHMQWRNGDFRNFEKRGFRYVTEHFYFTNMPPGRSSDPQDE